MKNSALDNTISEQALKNHLDLLPKEITPERDLWSGIEYAINNVEQSPAAKLIRFNTPLAWAASVVVAVLLSWQLNMSLMPVQTAQHKQTLQHNEQQGEQQRHYDVVNFIQQSFKQQKQSLLVSYGNPDLKKLPKTMQQELQQLSAAQTAIYQALAKDNNNQNLLNLLQYTQQQELKLLEQLYRPLWQAI